MFYANRKKKGMRVPTITSYKIDFKPKTVTKNKGHYIVKMSSIKKL